MESYNIIRWDTKELIFKTQANSLKEALEIGVRKGIDFRFAKLNRAELNDAKLNDAELNGAELNHAELNGAELSGSIGLLNPAEWLSKNFSKNGAGFIVFKAIGGTYYTCPEKWEIEPQNYIEEEINFLRTNMCGCGVNFGTFEYVKKEFPDAEKIWRCLLHFKDLPLLCVPYNTDGKARCGRLQLLEIIN